MVDMFSFDARDATKGAPRLWAQYRLTSCRGHGAGGQRFLETPPLSYTDGWTTTGRQHDGFDWATTDDQDYEMECKCGRPGCRRIVTGKDWMNKELQEKYKGWFCWFLQKRIDGGKRSW